MDSKKNKLSTLKNKLSSKNMSASKPKNKSASKHKNKSIPKNKSEQKPKNKSVSKPKNKSVSKPKNNVKSKLSKLKKTISKPTKKNSKLSKSIYGGANIVSASVGVITSMVDLGKSVFNEMGAIAMIGPDMGKAMSRPSSIPSAKDPPTTFEEADLDSIPKK